MEEIDILKKALKVKKPLNRCVCKGKIDKSGPYTGYCVDCGLDYSVVEGDNKDRYIPAYNYRQRELLNELGLLKEN